MTRAGALVRAAFLTDASYRVGMLASLAGLAATAVPVYFIARAMQPTMEDAIRAQGGEYFGFVLVGMAATYLVSAACTGLPGAVSSGIRTGTLEALLATSARVPALVAGLAAYPLIWTGVRAGVLLGAGWVLGARYAATGVLTGAGIALLLVLAYLPFGLLGAALLLTVRTTGPLLQGVLVVSILLGGVYYPTEVVPGGLRAAAALVPLTYALRALRRVLLEGAPPSAVAGDVLALAALAAGLMAVGAAALAAALGHARRAGTLARY